MMGCKAQKRGKSGVSAISAAINIMDQLAPHLAVKVALYNIFKCYVVLLVFFLIVITCVCLQLDRFIWQIVGLKNIKDITK